MGLLAREADWLPPWRDLLRVYHRLEARGEIRGGRFVAAVAGEQFALPEALGLLREVRKRPLTGEMLAFETLTLCPIATSCIDLGLMRADEIAWLNAYHAMVREREAKAVAALESLHDQIGAGQRGEREAELHEHR